MQESVAVNAANAARRAAAAWPVVTRVLFRFTFAYFVLFALPNLESMVPGMAWVERTYFDAQYRITPWIGKHVLGMTRTVSVSELSSGDRATDYLAFLCIMVLSLAVTVVWSIADRRARAYPRLDAIARVDGREAARAHSSS